MSDEQVAPGENVLTSGGDQIFPKGLPVGTVTKVGPGKDLFLNIKVKPAADLSRLEEVLVVTEKQERQPVAQSGASVRAADILARRLPSVPDKPATIGAGFDSKHRREAAAERHGQAGGRSCGEAGREAGDGVGCCRQLDRQSAAHASRCERHC